MRKINVHGTSEIQIQPTVTNISMKISGSTKTFDEAVMKSAAEMDKFRDIIETLGFKRSDLKTINLDIDTETETYRDENDNYREKFIGYKYIHKMFLEFPKDNKRLSEIITALVKSKIEFEFTVSYTCSKAEKKEYAERLIAEAFNDANKKAKVIASAAGVELGDIEIINYSDSASGYYNGDFIDSVLEQETFCMDFMEAELDFSIETKDISLSDEIDVVWEIK